MKTNNIFNTGDVKVGDAEALSTLGIETEYFRKALQGSSQIDTFVGVLEKRKQLQQQENIPLSSEQWKVFWEKQGKDPETIMRLWHFEEDGTVVILSPFVVRLDKPLPYGIKIVAGQLDIIGDANKLGEMPEIINGHLVISSCHNLLSLKGLEYTEVRKCIIINNCSALSTLEGLPMRTKSFIVFIECTSLQTLAHLPNYVGGLDLRGCPDLDNFPETSQVKGDIVVLPTQTNLQKVLESQGRSYHILEQDE